MSLLKSLWAKRSKGKPARFELYYRPTSDQSGLHVGELAYDGDTWTFRYADEYKRHRAELRPLEGLDDLDIEYRSTVLFPFFAVRIPDVDRDDVREKLERARVKDPEAADLLRLFGRRVVSSPAFELIPSALEGA